MPEKLIESLSALPAGVTIKKEEIEWVISITLPDYDLEVRNLNIKSCVDDFLEVYKHEKEELR